MNNRTHSSSVAEIENGHLKVRCTVTDAGIEQAFFARAGERWKLVAASFRPGGPPPDGALQLYDSSLAPGHRVITSEARMTIKDVVRDGDAATIILTGDIGGHQIEQTISLLPDSDYAHIDVRVELAGLPPRLEYVLSPYTFEVDAEPEFIHSPALKFAEDDVISDRVFETPAIMLQHGGQFVALAPDLDAINQFAVVAPSARQVATGNGFSVPYPPEQVTMPTALDFLMHSGWTQKPLLSYGVIDSIATHHMHWRHPSDGTMVRELRDNVVRYAFDLFVSADAPRFQGYQRITRHFWKRYGSRHFRQPRPQAMPFDEYAKECYPASFAYLGSVVVVEDGERKAAHRAPDGYPDLPSWLEWEIDGVPVGGYRNNAPQWYDLIGNTMFWNNVRDSVTLYWWGRRVDDSSLIDKARRGLNLALAAPQHKGMFPTIYRFQGRRWQNNHWEPPMELDPTRTSLICERYFDDYSVSYHTASMSKTAAQLLRYYSLCEPDPRILPYVRRYADFLVSHIDDDGCVPAWFSPDLQPNPHLRFNGESGVHAWVLAELYRLTGEGIYLSAARRIAQFVAEQILPRMRWLDTECYFSCGSKPMDFYDAYQHQKPRGTLAMIWAAEGFAALYRATGDPNYLNLGERVLDYALVFQAVWHPHFIVTAYAFGGWNTDNGDAAWLDARQGEFADVIIYYGKALGRQDLIERGIASARSALTLVNHPRHIDNGIYPFPNFPYGLGPENIDHEGHPQSTMRTDASWGEVAGLCGVSDVMRQLGGVYVDVENDLAAGVDALVVKHVAYAGNTLDLALENALDQLPVPYAGPFDVRLHVAGLPDSPCEIVVNGTDSVRIVPENGGFACTIRVEGDSISLAGK